MNDLKLRTFKLRAGDTNTFLLFLPLKFQRFSKILKDSQDFQKKWAMNDLKLRTFTTRAGGTKTFLVDKNDDSYVYKYVSNFERREIDFYRDLTASLRKNDDETSRYRLVSKFHFYDRISLYELRQNHEYT